MANWSVRCEPSVFSWPNRTASKAGQRLPPCLLGLVALRSALWALFRFFHGSFHLGTVRQRSSRLLACLPVEAPRAQNGAPLIPRIEPSLLAAPCASHHQSALPEHSADAPQRAAGIEHLSPPPIPLNPPRYAIATQGSQARLHQNHGKNIEQGLKAFRNSAKLDAEHENEKTILLMDMQVDSGTAFQGPKWTFDPLVVRNGSII
ncbi:hypothetical protein BRADI_2g45486v3 [Brachypodium distachyon]|uniref:Uncharacterized protein n=1 Tax=Brachypodium distachyon TaxID=15368 RepID=A0A2K2DDY9_BRADI|nr:hypothetical protein BRADI_2g45486v3 [Brachypodium distachyon]